MVERLRQYKSSLKLLDNKWKTFYLFNLIVQEINSNVHVGKKVRNTLSRRKVYPAKTTKGIKTFPYLYYENNRKMH